MGTTRKINYDYRSRHFTLREMLRSETAERLGIDNTPNDGQVFNLMNLMSFLDEIWEGFYNTLPEEEQAKFYIKVNSGFRSWQLNDAVGGAQRSQHRLGNAADITLGSREKNIALFNWIKSEPKVLKNLRYDQIINEKNGSWLHIGVFFTGQANRMQIFSLK